MVSWLCQNWRYLKQTLIQWLQYLLWSVLMISLVSKWTHSNLSDFLEFFTLSSHWDLLLLLMVLWLCQNWRHLEPLCALGCENLMNVLTFRNGCECTYIRASSISEFQTVTSRYTAFRSAEIPNACFWIGFKNFQDTWVLREFALSLHELTWYENFSRILLGFCADFVQFHSFFGKLKPPYPYTLLYVQIWPHIKNTP